MLKNYADNDSKIKDFFEYYTFLENVSNCIFKKKEFYSDSEENNSDLDMNVESD